MRKSSAPVGQVLYSCSICVVIEGRLNDASGSRVFRSCCFKDGSLATRSRTGWTSATAAGS